jgi:hypothetical protein
MWPFNKQQQNLGMWILIDYTPEAKKWAVGGAMNKKIYTFYNKTLIQVENYNIVRHNAYKKQGIYIFDKTAGTDKPADAIDVSIFQQSLSEIELYRRLR